MRSAYRVVDIVTVTTWDQPSILKTFVYDVTDDSGETRRMCDAQLAAARITDRLENPLQSTLMDIERLKARLRECGLNDEEWSIFESCLCMDGFMVRKHTGNATNSPHARGLPLRACCMLHERDSVTECCGLFYPPDGQFDGRHEFDIHNHKGRQPSPACPRPESSTNHALSNKYILPSPVGSATGCLLRCLTTAMAMSAIGIQLMGPSTVPCPVPCSCL